MLINNRVSAIVSQSRLQYVPLPLLAIISGFILSKNYNLIQLFFASISFLFIHCFESSVNNTYDAKNDRLSVIMRDKNPIVTGDLTYRDAKIMNFATPLLALIFSVFAGVYWTILIFIIAGLVVLYDMKPFRMKDTPFEILIVPFYATLPFLFSYLNGISNFTFSPLLLFVLVFLFLNLITDLRHIPDYETDLLIGANTFTVTFGVEATRKLETIVSISLLFSLFIAVALGIISMWGLPILVFTTYFKLNILMKQNEGLKDPRVWKRFSQIMIINTGAMVLSIVGIF